MITALRIHDTGQTMRILIYGAGGTGSYLAAHLALAGHEVTLADGNGTPDNHLSVVTDKDVQLPGVQVRAASSLEAALAGDPFAWIGLTAPAYETTTIAYALADSPHRTTPVVSFQTGIGNEVTLSAVLGPEPVSGGCITAALEPPAEGTIREVRHGGICLAGNTATLAPAIQSLADTGLHIETYSSIETLKWSKLFVDLIGNALPAILDRPPAQAYRDYRLFDIEWASLKETLWVLDHTNVELVNMPGAPARRLSAFIHRLPRQLTRLALLRYLRQYRGDVLPPLLNALHAGRQTEVAWLNGAIVYRAQGIQRLAPINHALALTVSDIAAGRIPWDVYRQNPDMLLKTIHLAQGQTG